MSDCLKFSMTVMLTFVALTVGYRFAWAKDINYEAYEKVLNMYVDNQGQVDYKGLQSNRALLDNFINEMIIEVNINDLTKDEQKAFWINAYNALTLQLIIDHYPLRFGGIRTINWGRPWSIEKRVAQQTLSLGDIEHEILRKWEPIDPRIHFVINCASGGCPKLPNTHFDPRKLEQQLIDESIRFINDPSKVRLDRAKNILYYSEILKWFEEDFLAVSPDIKSYILKYLNDDDKAYVMQHDVKLDTLKYDWSLNEQ